MFKTARATRGRLTEAGGWLNPETNKMAAYRGENVEVTVLDNGRFKVAETTQGENYCFCLEWDFSKVVETDICGYGERAVDSKTKQPTEYYARPVLNEEGNVCAIRVDCVDKLWFWLQIDVFY